MRPAAGETRPLASPCGQSGALPETRAPLVSQCAGRCVRHCDTGTAYGATHAGCQPCLAVQV